MKLLNLDSVKSNILDFIWTSFFLVWARLYFFQCTPVLHSHIVRWLFQPRRSDPQHRLLDLWPQVGFSCDLFLPACSSPSSAVLLSSAPSSAVAFPPPDLSFSPPPLTPTINHFAFISTPLLLSAFGVLLYWREQVLDSQCFPPQRQSKWLKSGV